MSRRLLLARPAWLALLAAALAAAGSLAAGRANAADATTLPVTPQQRAIAQQTAQTGVPVADLAPNAPDTYTVVPHDTLWGISGMFLKQPWRWPELWGMNLDQVRNPHLIYPGQVLTLERADGRARLRIGQGGSSAGSGAGGTVRLSPRVRATPLDGGALSSIALNLIEPFLNEAVILDDNALAAAPRIVATEEGRVLLGRGNTAYVRGDLAGAREFRIFREAKPLRDPLTREILGYEAAYVGAADFVRDGEARTLVDTPGDVVPSTFVVTNVRQEAGVGDRLAPVPAREFTNYVPHAPQAPLAARIVSIYGDALTAGRDQIVSLNRGAVDGIERGHVLAVWRAGVRTFDRTDGARTAIKLPDERHGMLFVFRVFRRMSYGLILNVAEPVKPGDVVTEP